MKYRFGTGGIPRRWRKLPCASLASGIATQSMSSLKPVAQSRVVGHCSYELADPSIFRCVTAARCVELTGTHSEVSAHRLGDFGRYRARLALHLAYLFCDPQAPKKSAPA